MTVISEAIRELEEEAIVLQANPPPKPKSPSGLMEWQAYRKAEAAWKLRLADLWGRVDALRSIIGSGEA